MFVFFLELHHYQTMDLHQTPSKLPLTPSTSLLNVPMAAAQKASATASAVGLDRDKENLHDDHHHSYTTPSSSRPFGVLSINNNTSLPSARQRQSRNSSPAIFSDVDDPSHLLALANSNNASNPAIHSDMQQQSTSGAAPPLPISPSKVTKLSTITRSPSPSKSPSKPIAKSPTKLHRRARHGGSLSAPSSAAVAVAISKEINGPAHNPPANPSPGFRHHARHNSSPVVVSCAQFAPANSQHLHQASLSQIQLHPQRFVDHSGDGHMVDHHVLSSPLKASSPASSMDFHSSPPDTNSLSYVITPNLSAISDSFDQQVMPQLISVPNLSSLAQAHIYTPHPRAHSDVSSPIPLSSPVTVFPTTPAQHVGPPSSPTKPNRYGSSGKQNSPLVPAPPLFQFTPRASSHQAPQTGYITLPQSQFLPTQQVAVTMDQDQVQAQLQAQAFAQFQLQQLQQQQLQNLQAQTQAQQGPIGMDALGIKLPTTQSPVLLSYATTPEQLLGSPAIAQPVSMIKRDGGTLQHPNPESQEAAVAWQSAAHLQHTADQEQLLLQHQHQQRLFLQLQQQQQQPLLVSQGQQYIQVPATAGTATPLPVLADPGVTSSGLGRSPTIEQIIASGYHQNPVFMQHLEILNPSLATFLSQYIATYYPVSQIQPQQFQQAHVPQNQHHSHEASAQVPLHTQPSMHTAVAQSTQVPLQDQRYQYQYFVKTEPRSAKANQALSSSQLNHVQPLSYNSPSSVMAVSSADSVPVPTVIGGGVAAVSVARSQSVRRSNPASLSSSPQKSSTPLRSRAGSLAQSSSSALELKHSGDAPAPVLSKHLTETLDPFLIEMSSHLTAPALKPSHVHAPLRDEAAASKPKRDRSRSTRLRLADLPTIDAPIDEITLSKLVKPVKKTETFLTTKRTSNQRKTNLPPGTVDEYIEGPDSEGRFKCLFPECEKNFSRRYNIRSHVQTHLSDRPYVCNVCDSKFVRPHDLRRHLKSHDPTKEFTCECGKGFTRHDALQKHNSSHILITDVNDGGPRCVLRHVSSGKVGRPKKDASKDKKKKKKKDEEEEPLANDENKNIDTVFLRVEQDGTVVRTEDQDKSPDALPGAGASGATSSPETSDKPESSTVGEVAKDDNDSEKSTDEDSEEDADDSDDSEEEENDEYNEWLCGPYDDGQWTERKSLDKDDESSPEAERESSPEKSNADATTTPGKKDHEEPPKDESESQREHDSASTSRNTSTTTLPTKVPKADSTNGADALSPVSSSSSASAHEPTSNTSTPMAKSPDSASSPEYLDSSTSTPTADPEEVSASAEPASEDAPKQKKKQHKMDNTGPETSPAASPTLHPVSDLSPKLVAGSTSPVISAYHQFLAEYGSGRSAAVFAAAKRSVSGCSAMSIDLEPPAKSLLSEHDSEQSGSAAVSTPTATTFHDAETPESSSGANTSHETIAGNMSSPASVSSPHSPSLYHQFMAFYRSRTRRTVSGSSEMSIDEAPSKEHQHHEHHTHQHLQPPHPHNSSTTPRTEKSGGGRHSAHSSEDFESFGQAWIPIPSFVHENSDGDDKIDGYI